MEYYTIKMMKKRNERLDGIRTSHNGKIMYFLLVATLPTKLATESFQNHT